ncbi:MAG TPA: histidine phosphatase family protein [Spirochaetota bacterium]|nr:histidine phosphatase family protein [Spirochaetota bacterium]HPR47966.1 histidine phosphatase family protein [Spirochaetota bacterium]
MTADKTEIIALRHGETEWNRKGIQQGHLDSPLTEPGRQQALLAGRFLRAEGASRLYTSDLGRALRTAEIIGAEVGLQPLIVPGLRERCLGLIQGMSLEEFSRKHPDECRLFLSSLPDYVPPEGESIRQRHERIINAVMNIADENAGTTIIMVMHGGGLDSLLRHTLDIPLESKRMFSLYNTSVARFTFGREFKFLRSWGCTGHLSRTALDDF